MKILTRDPNRIRADIELEGRLRHDQTAKVDAIYTDTEARIDFELNQRRVKVARRDGGPSVRRTMAFERNCQIERDCSKRVASERVVQESNNVTRVLDQVAALDESAAMAEKLKGRFEVRLNAQLPMDVKINKLGVDPLAFHMHKNRQFIRKLEEPPRADPASAEDLIARISADLHLRVRDNVLTGVRKNIKNGIALFQTRARLQSNQPAGPVSIIDGDLQHKKRQSQVGNSQQIMLQHDSLDEKAKILTPNYNQEELNQQRTNSAVLPTILGEVKLGETTLSPETDRKYNPRLSATINVRQSQPKNLAKQNKSKMASLYKRSFESHAAGGENGHDDLVNMGQENETASRPKLSQLRRSLVKKDQSAHHATQLKIKKKLGKVGGPFKQTGNMEATLNLTSRSSQPISPELRVNRARFKPPNTLEKRNGSNENIRYQMLYNRVFDKKQKARLSTDSAFSFDSQANLDLSPSFASICRSPNEFLFQGASSCENLQVPIQSVVSSTQRLPGIIEGSERGHARRRGKTINIGCDSNRYDSPAKLHKIQNGNMTSKTQALNHSLEVKKPRVKLADFQTEQLPSGSPKYDKLRARIRDDISSLLSQCWHQGEQSKFNQQRLNDMREEMEISSSNWNNVFETLKQLDSSQQTTIDKFFQYHKSQRDDYMQEASQITWDFKCNAGVLNSTKSCHYKVKRKPVLRRRNNDEGRILE